ncbi:hypothetical protein BRD00_03590 [Halobacteriales archaeon QS_8_69_26]|nr:MAG: hypothetical protein BRD00_03590 [Halobacteriales archaeon QS_8_69_26]
METVETRPLTTWDKVAGLVVVGLMMGFLLNPIQSAVATVLSLVFHPLSTVLPFSALLSGVGSATGLITTVVAMRLRDDDRAQELKERAETLQERLDGDDEDELEELSPELANTQWELLKTSIRPALWSALVTVPTFLWLRWMFADPATALAPAVVVLPALGPVTLTATIVGPVKVWLAWYLGASISTRLVTRRAIRYLS